MADKLPLQVRVDVRDKFSSDNAPIRECFRDIEKVLGKKVQFDPEWLLLWKELSAHFPDKKVFVPEIVEVVGTWCRVLKARLGDDALSEWADELVQKLEARPFLSLKINVGLCCRSARGKTEVFRSQMRRKSRLTGTLTATPSVLRYLRRI